MKTYFDRIIYYMGRDKLRPSIGFNETVIVKDRPGLVFVIILNIFLQRVSSTGILHLNCQNLCEVPEFLCRD